MIVNMTPKATQPTPAKPVSDDPKPLYMVLCCRGETYADPVKHNPIGVTGDIYNHPAGAGCLWDQFVGGQIPLGRLPAGTEVILHLPGGMRGKWMAVDAARGLSEEYKRSVADLVGVMRAWGQIPIVYAGCPKFSLTRASGLAAVDGWGAWCEAHKAGLIFDQSASLTDIELRERVFAVIRRQRELGLPAGVEGMAAWESRAIVEAATHHFLEMRSVLGTFAEGAGSYYPTAVPFPEKVVVWDQHAQASSREAFRYLKTNPLGAGQSSVGAEKWRFHVPGGPRLILGGGSEEVRILLGAKA